MIALIIMLIFSAVTIFCGYMIRFKKTYWILSGFSSMSEEDKKHINKEKICIIASNSLFIIAGFLILGSIFLYFNLDFLGIIFLFAIFPLTFIAVLISQKYYHVDSYAKNKKQILLPIIILGLLSTIIISSVIIMLINASKPNNYSINNNILKVSGTYGKKISIADIKSVQLKKSLPKKLSKRIGFDMDTILKGNFSSDIGNIYISIDDTSKPPFIYINTNNGLIIINCETRIKTQKLYEKLKKQDVTYTQIII